MCGIFKTSTQLFQYLEKSALSLSCRNFSHLYYPDYNHSNISRQLLKPRFEARDNARHISAESVRETYNSWFRTITESDTVDFAKQSLVIIHDSTGLPWYGTIGLTTLGLRLLVTLPLGIYQTYVIAKLELCKVNFQKVIEELKQETAVAIKRFNWPQKHARNVYNASAKKQWRLLVEKENCHPVKTMLMLWVQIPIWVVLSLALRCMAFKYGQDASQSDLIAQQLSMEGFGWVPDLLLPDATGILPIVVCVTNLAIIELQSCSHPSTSRARKILTNVFRGFAIITVPIALNVPSCMSLYWSISSILALTQNVALMSPRLKASFGIPRTPSFHPKPYQEAWTNFKSKLSLKK